MFARSMWSKRPRNNCEFPLISDLPVISNPGTLRDAVFKIIILTDSSYEVFCDNDDKGALISEKTYYTQEEKCFFPVTEMSVLSRLRSVKER